MGGGGIWRIVRRLIGGYSLYMKERERERETLLPFDVEKARYGDYAVFVSEELKEEFTRSVHGFLSEDFLFSV